MPAPNRPTTSLCWSCTRAYARPSPDGCGWIREMEQVFEEAEVVAEEKHSGEILKYYRVTKCREYVLSERAIRDADQHPGITKRWVYELIRNSENNVEEGGLI